MALNDSFLSIDVVQTNQYGLNTLIWFSLEHSAKTDIRLKYGKMQGENPKTRRNYNFKEQ